MKNLRKNGLTLEERAAIIAMSRQGISPVEIARRTGRHHKSVCLTLEAAGLRKPRAKPAPMTLQPEILGRDVSTITLVGITDKARILEFVQQFGAARIRVIPAKLGKVYGEVHHGR